jgi:hypothetical protein
MTTTIYLYIGLAALLAATFVFLALRRRKSPIGLDQAGSLMDSLDLAAFRNLVDPEEEAFLQSRLPAAEFRKIRRERTWAALAYVRDLSHIALEFSRFAHAAQSSSDPRLSELGRGMAYGALSLRLLALQATGRLFVTATFPALPPRRPDSLLEQYTRSTSLMIRYGMMEHAQKRAS